MNDDPIYIGPEQICLTVKTAHGPDWFPFEIQSSPNGLRLTTMLYLRRDELRALRDRLNEIDDKLPDPNAKPLPVADVEFIR